MGLVAVVATQGDELRLTIRSLQTRRRVAVVVGSESFIRKALSTVGLGAATPIPGLFKHGNGAGVPFVRRKPADGNL